MLATTPAWRLLRMAHRASVWKTGRYDRHHKGLVYSDLAPCCRGWLERNCGYIINIGSTAGHLTPAKRVCGATKALSYRLPIFVPIRHRVRVTDIEPGLVGGTEFSNVRFKGDDAKAEKAYENTGALTPEDVTEALPGGSPPAVTSTSTPEMMPVRAELPGLSSPPG